MTIGFDASRAFISDKTGTENYSYQLLKALGKVDKKNKYLVYLRPDSSVIARPRSGEAIYYQKDRHVANAPRDDGYKWPDNFQFKVINFPRLWTQLGLAIQTFKDRLDILFVPAHTLPMIRKPGLKTVVTVHDLGSEYLPSMHQLKQRLYLSLMQKYQLKEATKIIAVSKATRDDLIKRLGINSSKIEVIYEGYDKDLFSAKGGSSSGRQYFLFIGTLQPRKNIERLIRAFAVFSSLRDHGVAKQSTKQIATSPMAPRNDAVQLVIAGSKGWMSKEIYLLPKDLGIEDRVKFLGYVADRDLPALYSGAQALVFPSLFEGFGLPILEAQACGCPVITSNTSSMPEVAGSGAILVDPYDINDIVKGMKETENLDTRNKLIKAGFENIKRFSWEKCAKETLKVLADL